MLGIKQITQAAKEILWRTITGAFPDLVVVGKTGFAHFRNIQDAVTASGTGPGGSNGGRIILIKSGTYYENVKFDVTILGGNGGTWLVGVGRLVTIDGGTTGNAIGSIGNYHHSDKFINLNLKTTPGGGNNYSGISKSHSEANWVLFCDISASDSDGIIQNGSYCRKWIIAFNNIVSCDNRAIFMEGQGNLFLGNTTNTMSGLYEIELYSGAAVPLGARIIGNICKSDAVTNSVKQGSDTSHPVVLGNQFRTGTSIGDTDQTGVQFNAVMPQSSP